MIERSEHNSSRREILAAGFRYGALGLMGAGAGGIFVKRRRLVREGKCIGGGICDGCRVLSRCDLPLALSAKKDLVGGNNAGE